MKFKAWFYAITLGALALVGGMATTKVITAPTIDTVFMLTDMDFDKLQHVYSALVDREEGVNIKIYVDSPGGKLDSMVLLIQLINDTKANVEYIVSSSASSAAAITMCHIADKAKITMLDESLLMFHQVRFISEDGTVIPLKDMINNPDYSESAKAAGLLVDKCRSFLTQQEWNKLQNGGDVYIYGKDFKQRLKQRAHSMSAVAVAELPTKNTALVDVPILPGDIVPPIICFILLVLGVVPIAILIALFFRRHDIN